MYDLGINGQCHVYFKFVLQLVMRILFLFHFLIEDVHIVHNDCISCEHDDNKGFISPI